jgi:hypothetical protein
MSFVDMAGIIPSGAIGVAKVEHVVVSKQDADRYNLNPRRSRDQILPGTIAILTVDGQVMMSDTDMEKRSNTEFLHRAKGDVLVTGLGIGMILIPVLQKQGVTSVTVIEKYQDVVDLVLPAILKAVPDAKLTVIVQDALTWKPKDLPCTHYDVVYHDIWPTITGDNVPEMTLLKRRYARRLAKGGWQGCWQEYRCREENKRWAHMKGRY